MSPAMTTTPATRPSIATSMPPLPENKKRKIICFSDFDGTIFMQDTGHILFDSHGCGSKRREVLDAQIKSGERSFRDVSDEMWGSLNVPFDDGFDVMRDRLDIDPAFRDFHAYCLANHIPFNVISAGLKPVLRRVLDSFLGEEDSARIDIVANDAEIAPDGSAWKPIWRHADNDLGHDKALSMGEARQQAEMECFISNCDGTSEGSGSIPLIVFIGDGVSDLPAARHADVLFARRGLRLEEYCLEHETPHVPFDTFADIQREIQRIRDDDDRRTGGRGMPAAFNPRANMWRRVSSRSAVPRMLAMSPREEKMVLWPDVFSVVVDDAAAAKPAVEKGASLVSPVVA